MNITIDCGPKTVAFLDALRERLADQGCTASRGEVAGSLLHTAMTGIHLDGIITLPLPETHEH